MMGSLIRLADVKKFVLVLSGEGNSALLLMPLDFLIVFFFHSLTLLFSTAQKKLHHCFE